MAMIGSLSARSSNLSIVESVAKLAAGRFRIEIYDGIRDLPQFNPDLDKDVLPVAVVELRRAISEADMVLISTPEYVFGVPGALKNALDWTVSSANLRMKPAALIVASLSGEKAFESLKKTLETLEADICNDRTLLISHVKAKIGSKNEIKDEQTLSELNLLLEAMSRVLEK